MCTKDRGTRHNKFIARKSGDTKLHFAQENISVGRKSYTEPNGE